MADLDIGDPAVEMASQLFTEKHRAVLAAGAAHRHGDVAAAVLLEARQPDLEESADVVEHPLDDFVRFEKGAHFGVAAGERPQWGFPIGVRQAAHIEDDVGISGYAILVAEGLEQQREPALGFFDDALADGVLELLHRHAAGVNAEAGEQGDGFEQCRFLVDGFAQPHLAGGKRMLAAAFAEPLEQGFAAGVEENDFNRNAAPLEFRDDAGDEGEIGRQVARVDAHGDIDDAAGVGGDAVDERRQQARGEVVDTVVAPVLEIAQHRAFAGAGAAADDGQFHGGSSTWVSPAPFIRAGVITVRFMNFPSQGSGIGG